MFSVSHVSPTAKAPARIFTRSTSKDVFIQRPPPLGGDSDRISQRCLVVKKTRMTWLPHQSIQFINNAKESMIIMSSRYDTIPGRDRRTDGWADSGHTEVLSRYRASASLHALISHICLCD